jgi:hypothetical protein
MSLEQTDRSATIESIVTDQGNGGSYCSNCNYNLTEYVDQVYLKRGPEDARSDPACPGCTYSLTFGSMYINWGGSD